MPSPHTHYGLMTQGTQPISSGSTTRARRSLVGQGVTLLRPSARTACDHYSWMLGT